MAMLPRHMGRLSLLSVLSVAVTAAFALPPATPAAATATCDRGPQGEPTTATSNLDVPASAWGVFCDQGLVNATVANVQNPSLDGTALEESLTGGQPYSGLHVYRSFPAKPAASHLVVDLWFQFRPATTCNNLGGPSVVQALEFTNSKWSGGKRWETAVQYRNVGSEAPGWRYWDPHASGDKWVALPISQCVTANTWHHLRLTSSIVSGNVHYEQLLIDSAVHPLDITVAPADTPGEPDRLGIATQLDGNSTETPYDLFVDRISFYR